MGTELFRARVKEESMENQSIPPGFESLASFTLKRVKDTEAVTTCSDSASVSESQTMMEAEFEYDDGENITRSLKRRPWINYTPSDGNSGDESETKQSCSLRPSLPKGVIRGCSECANCQKVLTRWRPEEARRPDLEAVPVFYPSEEEFKDTLNYIASIRPHAEKYGICRIVPPPEWKPPCPLKEKKIWEKVAFATRVQRVDKLQNRDSMKKMLNMEGSSRYKRRCTNYGVDTENNSESGEKDFCVEGFGFEPGPEFTLDTFQKYANDFKLQYFRKNESVLDIMSNVSKIQEQWEPKVEDIEGEYWRMVEAPSTEVEVLYGADLETGSFGSGFPKHCNQGGSIQDEKYVNSGWNLNNLPRVSGSVLSYESSDISGVLVPWLYIGMCFSSFCWHVEDHHLYSMNYMHWGAPKMWYGIPGENALQLEEVMRKHLPELFDEQPDLLHKLVTQLSPSILKAEGVPVYRCVQNPGEFVLTFPRAYHSGFNCGFNCAEAVNVAPVDWLPYGQNAIELYREQGRKTSISHDKLLLGAARAAVKALWELNLVRKNTPDNLRWKSVCGKDGLLSKAFKHRVETERIRTQFLWNFSKPVKMESSFDSATERECAVCFFDLHLFAVGCHCSPDRYTCLYHAKQLCSCPWSVKSCLHRYSIEELNVLAEALDGKLSAIHKWVKQDLGLALSSYISKDKVLKSDVSNCLETTATGELSSQPPSSSSLKDNEGKESSVGKPKSAEVTVGMCLPKNEMPHQHVMKIENSKVSCSSSKSLHEDKMDSCSSRIMKEEDKSEVEKPRFPSKDNVILLSDDEGEEVSGPPLGRSIEGLAESGSVSVSSCDKDSTVPSAMNNTVVECEKDTDLLLAGENNNCSSKVSSGTCGNGIIDNETRNNSALNPNVSLTGVQNNVDKCIRLKGPRIAKVVRRFNAHIEALEYGHVISGKLWCNSRAIFPQGFKSRVKYISALDPTITCYYVSQILDARKDRPLFMVSVEDCPSEVFIHVSALKCWEMVRERVNQEITKQLKLGTKKLPPLQPPGSLDGIEMFGFSTPTIVQVIQNMDKGRVCAEYWESLLTRQCPHPRTEGNTTLMFPKTEIQNVGDDIETTLGGLFKKANLEELEALQTILNDDTSLDRAIATKLLHQEILKRRR